MRWSFTKPNCGSLPQSGPSQRSVHGATQTIPIAVPTCNDDLVEQGIIRSFKNPGGSITGMSTLTPQLATKRLELLLQAVPSEKRIAVLWNPGYSEFKADWRELRDAARVLGVTLVPFEFRRVDDLELVFDSILRAFCGAKAGDLPIEQTTLFELVINRKSANDLGISLLRRVDAVVD
ncbi:ABC transporter substrate binding protein [Variovorax sp. J2P1-59]|uniref:ABC transporter substrate binding protein n=1 Tax=Variovorax flavidus TaxID=3053501 RepID=UPI002577F9A6|nr:ABC transporter substrate binding protein [Variovorax sp. J2P1-59]MDM0078566.1 ABC transporter substrate binding protein [Variovorax sp. J2P1-59]